MTTSTKNITLQFGFSRQQLHYWRKVGIISPSARTSEPNGHFLYEFNDLRTLKTIKNLKDAGVSTFRIRKCFKSIKKYFPNIENPFVGKPIFVFGQTIIFVHKEKCYDAFSGQIYLLDFKKIKGWAGKVIKFKSKSVPQSADLVIYIQKIS